MSGWVPRTTRKWQGVQGQVTNQARHSNQGTVEPWEGIVGTLCQEIKNACSQPAKP